MAKAKTASKKSESNKADEGSVEARPIGAGKDPLAEGNTLVNPTNTEAETHYEVKEKSEDVQAQEAQNKIDGQDANERAEAHNSAVQQGAPSHETPNHDEAEQDAVAEDRTEPGSEDDSEEEGDPLDDSSLGDDESAADRQEAMDDAMAGGENPAANKKN